MSIASELTALDGYIGDAYDAVSAKGGTIPANKNMSNLGTAIGTITTGGTDYGIPRIVVGGALKKPASGYSYTLPTGVTKISGESAANTGMFMGGLSCAFQNDVNITSADLSACTQVLNWGLYSTFAAASNLASVDLSGLTAVAINGMRETFDGCTSLTTVTVGSSSMGAINQYGMYETFANCSGLTTATINASRLSGMYCLGNTFLTCTRLADVYFPRLSDLGSQNNAMTNMLSGCSGVTVHFLSSMSTNTKLQTYINAGFGGTNITALFDL